MITLSKAQVKAIASLRKAPKRRERGEFAVEGSKAVLDSLGHFPLRLLCATAAWLDEHTFPAANAEKIARATPLQMEQMTALSTPPPVLAIFELPPSEPPAQTDVKGGLTLLLDGVQDPGNLGTIVRCADWFGVRHIVCSPQTADVYSSKCVQATMGALARVKVSYCDLGAFLDSCPGIPLLGTLLEGEDLYTTRLPQEAFLLMGNEGRGVSPALRARIDRGLTIPPFPRGEETVESLNVAMATAICLYQFRHG